MKKNSYISKSVLQHSIYDKSSEVMLSEDGFVRLTYETLIQTLFHHLISIKEGSSSSDSPSILFGYTEWVSATSPIISIGWDWELIHTAQFVTVSRIGLPRGNHMLINHLNQDFGLQATLDLTAQWVDRYLSWESTLKNEILGSQMRDHMSLNYS